MSEQTLIGVSLAGNDDNGNWSGSVEAITIGDLCQLEGDALDCTNPAYNQITIGGVVFWSHGYIPWHGNMAWDSIRLSLTDAARLLAHLRAQHWTIIEGDARLFRAYEDGQAISAEQLEEWV